MFPTLSSRNKKVISCMNFLPESQKIKKSTAIRIFEGCAIFIYFNLFSLSPYKNQQQNNNRCNYSYDNFPAQPFNSFCFNAYFLIPGNFLDTLFKSCISSRECVVAFGGR